MGIKLDLNIRGIKTFSWGICFKGLSSSVIIILYITLQETAHEFEHIGWVPNTEIVSGKSVS